MTPMTLLTVTVRTAEKVNTAQGGTEDRFYRTYEIGNRCALFQWGSQRNGRSGGQFKIAPAPSDATDQFYKKIREGYVSVGPGSETFQVDDVKMTQQLALGHKAAGTFLDNLYAASPASSSSTLPPVFKGKPEAITFEVPADKPFDRIGQTNERALAAITLATTSPAKALTEYSLLQDEVDAMETDLRKVRSYLSTLEVLVEEAMDNGTSDEPF